MFISIFEIWKFHLSGQLCTRSQAVAVSTINLFTSWKTLRTGRTINMDAESDSAGSNQFTGSGQPRSAVWNYFEYIESSDKSVCKIESCGVEVRGKFTTNLKRHLERKHAEYYRKVEKIEEEKKKISNQSNASSKVVKKNDAKQHSMDDFMKRNAYQKQSKKYKVRY